MAFFKKKTEDNNSTAEVNENKEKTRDIYKDKYFILKEKYEQLNEDYQELRKAVDKLLQKDNQN